MFKFNPFNPFKRKKPVPDAANKNSAKAFRPGEPFGNWLEIRIKDTLVRIVRCSTTPPQNELSAIIPRAEIRRRRYENGRLAAEEEIILSSITLVDAPRHPPEKMN